MLFPRRTVPVRKPVVPPRCNGVNCKLARQCLQISEADRIRICSDFHNLGDRDLQRAFISRQIRQYDLQQTKFPRSHRSKTNYYYLPNADGEDVNVCQKMFLNTLNISEKVMRTALAKGKSSEDV
ncbi:uncharacterized protein LOC124356119 [Homalodisca vitripennis]|uniref:uncharacterized protein LOC124356119 n=1 Tax=Homalodisca vitripennis TaxID=197043 RepID=UPI001EECB8CE|nr:uncharacterized protein LOC124356119 [Homalodisca vitripennis]